MKYLLKYLHISSVLALFSSALVFAVIGCDADKSSTGGASESHEGHGHESDNGHHDATMGNSHMESGEHHEESSEHHMESGEHHHSATSDTEKPSDARLVTIKATDYEFSPAQITAKPAEKLYIKLVNEGTVVHMWQLRDKPDTHIHTPVGETSAKVVTAPESPGEYEFFCGRPGHEKRGMVGTLTVSEGDSGGHAH